MPTDSLVDATIRLELTDVKKTDIPKLTANICEVLNNTSIKLLYGHATVCQPSITSDPLEEAKTKIAKLQKNIDDVKSVAEVRSTAQNCVPDGNGQQNNSDEAQVREKLTEHFKEMQAKGKVVVKENKPAEKPATGGVPMPVAKKGKELPNKHYVKIPKDFDEKAIEYIGTHDGCSLSKLAEDLEVNLKSAFPHIEKLIKSGKVIKEKSGPAKWDPTKYHLAKPVSSSVNVPVNKEPEKPAVKEVLTKEPEGEKTKYTSPVIKSTTPVSDIKAFVVRLIAENPGMGLFQMTEKVHKSTPAIRSILIELEEEKTIERRIVNSRTGYFLKGAPKTPEASS